MNGPEVSRRHSRRERVTRSCRRLPGATLTYPFGEETAVFKVADRIFAIVTEDDAPGRVTLKCDPDYGSYLVQHYDDIIPGYHMSKRHWVTVGLTPGVPHDLVEDLISNSYDLVVAGLSARVRQALSRATRPQ